MNSVLYSWLAVAAVSPFVAILSCWTLAIFRSYRSEWRLLDIFLFALTTLEGVSALFSFGYSILGVIRPALEGPCQFMVWGWSATRTFHLSAVTSLLLDRALSTKWTKSYRSSVQQSQVRYHIVVLGIISVFVGVTSVFARNPAPLGSCSLHPLEWDLKFSALLTCVYGLLLITGLACCLLVQMNHFHSRGTYRTSWSRQSSSTCSEESCSDLEWTVAASICLLSYIINHAPYLVLNSLGMAQPSFWSPWLDNVVVWLQLAQGVLVPCVLLLADMPHRSALRNMLRPPGRIYRHLSDHGGFRLQIGGTNNSKPWFPDLPDYRGPIFPQRLRWSPTSLPSLQSLQPLDIDSLNKGYGSGGYTTLISLPSSTTAFSSPYSSCSSASQSVNSVTTNAVNDFVFRRPSALALFDPHPSKETSNHCHRYDEGSTGRRRCDTPTPFIDEQEMCSCTSVEDISSSSETSRDMISKSMINIILAYDDSSSSMNDAYIRSIEVSEAEDASASQGADESVGDLSSLTSTESSEVDSVQSVIIRQRVDQSGRVSGSDITIAQRKVIKCNKVSTNDSKDNNYSERRIIYSEYL